MQHDVQVYSSVHLQILTTNQMRWTQCGRTATSFASLRGHTGFRQRPVLEPDQDLPNDFERMRI